MAGVGKYCQVKGRTVLERIPISDGRGIWKCTVENRVAQFGFFVEQQHLSFSAKSKKYKAERRVRHEGQTLKNKSYAHSCCLKGIQYLTCFFLQEWQDFYINSRNKTKMKGDYT